MSEQIELAPAGYVWCGKKRELDVYLTHIVVEGNDDSALYIRNTARKVDSFNPITGATMVGCPAVLVPFRELWIYRPEDTDRGRWHTIGDMVGRLGNMAVMLYGFDTVLGRNRVHDAILDFADDVKNLRPPPEQTREQWLAEMAACGLTLKINGQRVN